MTAWLLLEVFQYMSNINLIILPTVKNCGCVFNVCILITECPYLGASIQNNQCAKQAWLK